MIDIFIYSILSSLSIILAISYLFYPQKTISLFLIVGLLTPTSNQFMSYISYKGLYFFDFFLISLLIYYLISLLYSKKIFKKNIFNIILGFCFVTFYLYLAFSNSLPIDKYLLRDLRPFLTILYAFIFISLIKKSPISFKGLMNSLTLIFICKILFFMIILFGFSFSDEYYQNNIFRYFDAVTFVSALFLITSFFMRDLILKHISNSHFNVIIILALIIILISNLRVLMLALALIFIFSANVQFFKKIIFTTFVLFSFLAYSYFIDADRVINSSDSEIVSVQLLSRFAPALDKIFEMKPSQYIFGLGFGTYFEIPWFAYRSLDTKLNTIDSTYLTLFVKYGLCSFLLILLFFRLLIFNVFHTKVRRSVIVFYLILFFTISSLYQSGTVFHFLFLNLFFLSINNENTSCSISVNS